MMSSSNQLCEAVGCNANTTENIEVPAGRFGSITISVCKKCALLFQERNAPKSGHKGEPK